LTEITIPVAVKSIDDHAFENCDGLTAVRYEGDLTNWCEIEFGGGLSRSANPAEVAGHLYVQESPVEGVVTLPDGVTKINRRALCGLVDVTAFVFPSSVETVGYLQGCVNLEYLLFEGSPIYAGDTYSYTETKLAHVYLTDTRDEAIPYIPYLATACNAVGADWHYVDEWGYNTLGVPQRRENLIS
jgi:hypothetical protein